MVCFKRKRHVLSIAYLFVNAVPQTTVKHTRKDSMLSCVLYADGLNS